MKLIKTIIKIIFAILILLAVFAYYHSLSNAPVTVAEIFRDDEAAQTQRSKENFIAVIEQNKTSYVARGAHSKGHACVKAYFDVHETIPSNLQHGVFKTPGKRYKIWIRFSNGRSSMKGNHDADKDAHGMAIKLFHIYDDIMVRTEDGPGDGRGTQDFLMHDSPVFFAANIEDYNRFVESEDKIMYFITGNNPFKWHLRELTHALATLKAPPVSPLWGQYFSNTAYKLGPHNIKFSAQSCTTLPGITGQETSDPDFLRKIMVEELKTEEGCFNFMVQLQNPDKYMPIEDPSILWKESDSPYISLAKIIIPKQKFDSEDQQQFCENLSFSPWNALPEHRPIGQLNRIRKEVYKASSKYRHDRNQTITPELSDWQI